MHMYVNKFANMRDLHGLISNGRVWPCTLDMCGSVYVHGPVHWTCMALYIGHVWPCTLDMYSGNRDTCR